MASGPASHNAVFFATGSNASIACVISSSFIGLPLFFTLASFSDLNDSFRNAAPAIRYAAPPDAAIPAAIDPTAYPVAAPTGTVTISSGVATCGPTCPAANAIPAPALAPSTPPA